MMSTNIGTWEISCDGYYPYCSECKTEPQDGEMTNYCPNCGAKMKNTDKYNKKNDYKGRN